MPFDIFKVQAGNFKSTTNELKKLGLDLVALAIVEDEIDHITKLCQDAAQSTVPIKTGELRNSGISKKKTGTFSATVSIDDEPHGTSNGKNSDIDNADLAVNILDVGYRTISKVNKSTMRGRLTKRVKLFRRKTSIAANSFTAIGAGEETRNWIKRAQNQLNEALDRRS